jgi:hypothetical protein
MIAIDFRGGILRDDVIWPPDHQKEKKEKELTCQQSFMCYSYQLQTCRKLYLSSSAGRKATALIREAVVIAGQWMDAHQFLSRLTPD